MSKRKREPREGPQAAADDRAERPKRNRKTHQYSNPNVDATSGQKYAFSLLGATTVPTDSPQEWEDDADAMAYLRAVQFEARAIPQTLVEKKYGPQPCERGRYDTGVGDFRGYYEDGAYIAAPHHHDDIDGRVEDGSGTGSVSAESGGEIDGFLEEERHHHARVRGAYYSALLRRFSALRARLHTKPPPSAVRALPHTHTPVVGRFGARSGTFRAWSQRLRTCDPHPVQIAAMDKEGVLRIVHILLKGPFMRRSDTLDERTSRWLWALLARLPDRGEMDYAEVGWVRDLGRRAVLLMAGQGQIAALRVAAENGGANLGVHDGVDWVGSDEHLSRDETGEVEMETEEVEMEMEVKNGVQEDGCELGEEADANVGGRESPGEEGELEEGELEEDQLEEGQLEEGQLEESHSGDSKTAASETASDASMDLSDDASGDSVRERAAQLEEARARLLRRVDSFPPGPAGDESAHGAGPDGVSRARANIRATLTMILTIAGEFYGQRDLLEFRKPFDGV